MNNAASFLIYAACLVALYKATKVSWIGYKEEGLTQHLALSCICGGLILFLTLVPGVIYLSIPHNEMPYHEINIDYVGDPF